MEVAAQLQRENSEGTEKRLLNLRPFQKGVSGNPGGRPRGSSVSAALRRLVAEGNTADEIAQVIVAKAREGDIDFLRLLLDRAEGGVMKQIQLSAPKPPEEMTLEEIVGELRYGPPAIEIEGGSAQPVALNSLT